LHRLIRGVFVIVGKEPDGDSVRFVAADPALFAGLKDADLVHPARDGSVQLRLAAVDAPELHYGPASQPLAVEARDGLLRWLGFSGVTFLPGTTVVGSSVPGWVPGAILTAAVEVNGRPVSYAFVGADTPAGPDGSWLDVDDTLLDRSLNGRLLANGTVYYTVYSSTPEPHRRRLRDLARRAREAASGVWALDTTAGFLLTDQSSIGPGGALVLPKLFRRCTDYLTARAGGFTGTLADWLRANSSPAFDENDRVALGARSDLRLADLLTEGDGRVVLHADLLDVVFIEE